MRRYGAPPPCLLALIHRSAWKGCSAKFAFIEFSEVPRYNLGVLDRGRKPLAAILLAVRAVPVHRGVVPD